MRITRFWRDAVRVRRGFLERRTGGEFWRLLGAAPARRPFTAGLVRPALRSRRPRAGSPWQSPQTRFASACRSRVSLTTFPCGFHRKDERSDCETAGTALPLADSGGRSAAQRRSRLARPDGRNLSPQPPRWACAPPKVCAPSERVSRTLFANSEQALACPDTPELLPPKRATSGHMIAASAPFASCGLTWTQISDAGVAPRAGIGEGDAAAAGRSCRGC